jgi:hypothetical protein
MFRYGNFEEFIRIVVFDDNLLLCHFKNGKLQHTSDFGPQDKKEVFEYLNKNTAIPVEVAIHSSTLACQSISASNLKSGDIRALATNLLSEKDESIDTMFYEASAQPGCSSVIMCDMRMQPEILAFVQGLPAAKNPILSISCWPLLVARHYYDLHESDVRVFAALLLIIECDESWEMIVTCDGSCAYYRSGDTSNFDRTTEIENTLKYINKILKIKPSDIVIHSVSRDVILNFTKASPIHMGIISKAAKVDIVRYSRGAEKIIKLGCIFVTLLTCVCSTMDLLEIWNHKGKLTEARKVIKSIDKRIFDEASLWQSLEANSYGSSLDCKAVLLQHIRDDAGILRNASIAVGPSAKDVKVSVVKR